MATARSGHASATFLHAHAKPWAWHPLLSNVRHNTAMLIWYAAGTVAAIVIAWLASLVHASGHAPLGLVSIAVGVALGVALWKLAGALRTLVSRRHLVLGALLLSIVTIVGEHTWLYLDFRRQWTAAREKSPQVALFRPESPWSFREFVANEADGKHVTLWSIDAIIILVTTIATVLIFPPQSPAPNP